MEKSGWGMASVETKCWKKYTELTKELSEDSIETEIIEAVARYAEDLMRGTAKTPEI